MNVYNSSITFVWLKFIFTKFIYVFISNRDKFGLELAGGDWWLLSIFGTDLSVLSSSLDALMSSKQCLLKSPVTYKSERNSNSL